MAIIKYKVRTPRKIHDVWKPRFLAAVQRCRKYPSIVKLYPILPDASDFIEWLVSYRYESNYSGFKLFYNEDDAKDYAQFLRVQTRKYGEDIAINVFKRVTKEI
jgi:hypothetical protein